MVLAERCSLLSAEILKSQGKYSDAATLLIKMTSEVRHVILIQHQTQDVCTLNSIYMNLWLQRHKDIRK